MKEFDYIIRGGGCAGLSLAYQMDISEKYVKIRTETLVIMLSRRFQCFYPKSSTIIDTVGKPGTSVLINNINFIIVMDPVESCFSYSKSNFIFQEGK